MLAGAVGEDELAAAEFFQCGAERRVWLERGVIDLVHEFEKIVGPHPVLGHQPTHRRAVAPVVILLHAERLLVRDVEKTRDVVADALVHLLPQIEVMRVERVVEIEHPGLDMVEPARRWTRGSGCRRHAVTHGSARWRRRGRSDRWRQSRWR